MQNRIFFGSQVLRPVVVKYFSVTSSVTLLSVQLIYINCLFSESEDFIFSLN